jgi:hypothetical protein
MSDLNFLLEIDENISIFCAHEVEHFKNNNDTLRTLFKYKEFKEKSSWVKKTKKESKFPDPQFVETNNGLKGMFTEEDMKKIVGNDLV